MEPRRVAIGVAHRCSLRNRKGARLVLAAVRREDRLVRLAGNESLHLSPVVGEAEARLAVADDERVIARPPQLVPLEVQQVPVHVRERDREMQEPDAGVRPRAARRDADALCRAHVRDGSARPRGDDRDRAEADVVARGGEAQQFAPVRGLEGEARRSPLVEIGWQLRATAAGAAESRWPRAGRRAGSRRRRTRGCARTAHLRRRRRDRRCSGRLSTSAASARPPRPASTGARPSSSRPRRRGPWTPVGGDEREARSIRRPCGLTVERVRGRDAPQPVSVRFDDVDVRIADERDPAALRRPRRTAAGGQEPLVASVRADDVQAPASLDDETPSVGRPVNGNLARRRPCDSSAMRPVGIDDVHVGLPSSTPGDVRDPPAVGRPGRRLCPRNDSSRAVGSAHDERAVRSREHELGLDRRRARNSSAEAKNESQEPSGRDAQPAHARKVARGAGL